jgi:hypothetical protein
VIVSYLHNYLFVKTKKTAGTSMEIALSAFAGNQDVITPITPEDELKRLEIPNARPPQNFCCDTEREEKYRRLIAANKLERAAEYYKRKLQPHKKFWNHQTLAQAREKLDPAFFATAFKFTIQRHPYDRMISQAYWRQRSQPAALADTVDQILAEESFSNSHFYMMDGKIAVDFVIRYENLRDDIGSVEQRLGGADLWKKMPFTKHEQRTDRRPAADLLTQAQRTEIGTQCKAEFELFGYDT